MTVASVRLRIALWIERTLAALRRLFSTWSFEVKDHGPHNVILLARHWWSEQVVELSHHDLSRVAAKLHTWEAGYDYHLLSYNGRKIGLTLTVPAKHVPKLARAIDAWYVLRRMGTPIGLS